MPASLAGFTTLPGADGFRVPKINSNRMGRRFALGSEAAFVGLAVGGAWSYACFRGAHETSKLAWILATGVPCIAGALLIFLAVAIPNLMNDGLTRMTATVLPIVHAALTAFVARAILTGPTAAAVPPEPLLPAALWLAPVSLVVLVVGELIVLHVVASTQRRDSQQGT